MFNNWISKIFGFIFRSDRAAWCRQIRQMGLEGHAADMAKNKRQTIKKMKWSEENSRFNATPCVDQHVPEYVEIIRSKNKSGAMIARQASIANGTSQPRANMPQAQSQIGAQYIITTKHGQA